MHIASTKPLFAWDELEDSHSLNSIRTFLATVPDQALIDSLRAARGHGRNDNPIPVLWRCFLLAVLRRHDSMDACLKELQRNSGLRLLIGIESESKVPKPSNMSRLLLNLTDERHFSKLRQVFDFLAERLGQVVFDLDRHRAGPFKRLIQACRREQEVVP
jgi:hypothetical protein